MPWLFAGLLLAFMSSFGQTYFISVFAGDIRAEFGLSNGDWGVIYSIGTSLSALVMIWAGALTDHIRARSLGIGALGLLALACFSMAVVPGSGFLVGIVFLLRFSGQGMLSHISAVSMTRWFVATRGRALAFATIGYALGEAFLPMIFVQLKTWIDWRQLWMIAMGVSLVGIPVLILLLRRERLPAHMVAPDSSTGMRGKHWTRRDAIAHPLFWVMFPAVLGPSAFVTALFFHQVHFADVKGWTHLQFVSLFPIYTTVSIGAMILSGWAIDRFGTARLIPWFQLPMVAAFVVFARAEDLIGASLGFVFLALTSGANSTLPSAFWAEFYGTRHIGAIKALAAAVMVLGSAIGPGLTGWLIDINIGLETQYLFVAIWFVLVTTLMAFGVGRARNELNETA